MRQPTTCKYCGAGPFIWRNDGGPLAERWVLIDASGTIHMCRRRSKNHHKRRARRAKHPKRATPRPRHGSSQVRYQQFRDYNRDLEIPPAPVVTHIANEAERMRLGIGPTGP